MIIEVDQSNKIEQTSRDTILALANDEIFTVVIPARVKREAFEHLRTKKKDKKTVCLQLFAAGLFILMKGYLKRTSDAEERIIIDDEYPGHDASIKGMILRHAHSAGLDVAKERFVFSRVGKQSSAHKAAWDVQRGYREADHRVTTQELTLLLK